MASKWKVTAYLPEEVKKGLDEWAALEHRSISNLAATILIKALEEYQQRQKEETNK